MRRQRGTANFRTTNSGAAPTSPPGGVFRRILRKKYRRAVGTHYWPTRIRRAGSSLCHRRDGRAGTTILQIVSAPDVRTKALPTDYGPAGLPEQGQRRRIRQSRRIFNETTGRRKQRVAAAELSVPQDLSKDYGPTGSSERRSRLCRGRSTCKELRAGTDPPDGYAGVHSGKRTTLPRELPGAGRRVSPMLGI